MNIDYFKIILQINGGLNNNVYEVKDIRNNQNYILKVFKDNYRDRFEREISFLRYSAKYEIKSVPDIHYYSKKKNYIVIEKLKGNNCKKIDQKYILKFSNFIKKINLNKKKYKKIFASDHFTSFDDCQKSISIRVKKTINKKFYLKSNTIKTMQSKIKHSWEYIISKKHNIDFSDLFNYKNIILSPSDFGPKNSIINNSSYKFIDFEYAGLDYSIKYICDFLTHPDLRTNTKLINYFLKKNIHLIKDAKFVEDKIQKFIPLFQIKWCCILINSYIDNYKIINIENRKKHLTKINYILNKLSNL